VKATPAALQAHNALEVTTIATCWKVTRTDGQVFGFTDSVADLVVSGITYLAASGYTASAIESAAALNVDNGEVQGGLDDATISEADLLAGLWDFAQIEIFEVNRADLTQGTRKLRRGWLGEVRTGRGAFVCELRGMMQVLQQSVGRLVAPACNADFADSRCGLVAATYTVSGTLTSVTSNRVFTDSGRAEATDYYAGGKITFTGGANAGIPMEVKAFTSGGIIEAALSLPFAVVAGDTYTLLAGCKKRLEEDCRDKFNNVVNFRGFPHLPGINRVVSGA